MFYLPDVHICFLTRLFPHSQRWQRMCLNTATRKIDGAHTLLRYVAVWLCFHTKQES